MKTLYFIIIVLFLTAVISFFSDNNINIVKEIKKSRQDRIRKYKVK
jgi:hypothetical protein